MFGLDACSTLIKVQHNIKRSLLMTTKQILLGKDDDTRKAGQNKSGVLRELAEIDFAISEAVLDHQYALEQDMIKILKKTTGVEREEKASSKHFTVKRRKTGTPNYRQNTNKAKEQQPPIIIMAETESGNHRIGIPVALKNHYDFPQIITLQATPIRNSQDEVIPAKQIIFRPSELNIPPKDSVTALAIVEITEEFKPGEQYYSDFQILGDENRVLNFVLKIKPDESQLLLSEGDLEADNIESTTEQS